MPLYQFKCPACGLREDTTDREAILLCDECDVNLKRDYSTVQLSPVMQEHYNASVNREVSSMRQLNDIWKRQSDDYSAHTGIEARFGPVDMKDVGATNEGLDSTNAVRRARGDREVSVE